MGRQDFLMSRARSLTPSETFDNTLEKEAYLRAMAVIYDPILLAATRVESAFEKKNEHLFKEFVPRHSFLTTSYNPDTRQISIRCETQEQLKEIQISIDEYFALSRPALIQKLKSLLDAATVIDDEDPLADMERERLDDEEPGTSELAILTGDNDEPEQE